MRARQRVCRVIKRLQKPSFSVSCGMSAAYAETGGRLRQTWQQKISICGMFSTGATRLEPATSGVTGHFEPHDG
jgi:hypothetical protein